MHDLSGATYTLSACRKLVGIGEAETPPHRLVGAPLSAVAGELAPTGRLKRTG